MNHKSTLLLALLVVFGLGCATTPTSNPGLDPAQRENAIFECKKEFQTKKKARFEKLPPVLRRLMGENRILKEFATLPPLAEQRRTIARFPLEGDSGGLWRSEENAHLKTVSGSLRNDDETLSLIFGQPGRVYAIPLSALARTKTGFQGTSGSSELNLRPIDDHHILVQAKAEDAKPLYAVIRTYAIQGFAEESKTILPDYPIYSSELNDESCEDIQ